MWYDMPFNIEFIKWVQHFSSPFLDKLFQYITMMGEDSFFILVLAIIYWCIDKKLGYKLGFILLSSLTFNSGIKEVLAVPRPFGEDGIRSLRIETATGYSFPSGHTQGITTFSTSLMKHIKRKAMYVIGAILIILVGFSRIYLGVHRPIDVLGALVIGVAWVFIFDSFFKLCDKKENKVILLTIAVPVLIGLFFIHAVDYYKSAGVFFGFMLGYVIEPKYIGFVEKTTLPKQILKLVIGLSIVLLIRVLVKIILPASNISDLFRYFLMGAWATIAAPYIFKKFVK